MVTRSTLMHGDADDLGPAGARSRIDGGRLVAYVALGASASALPLPWVPDALVRRVRGALVHDVAVRHGLSLTPEARDVLAEPAGADGPHGLASQALRYVGLRLALRALARFGPAAVVWPLRGAFRMYILGHLFDRYLTGSRTQRAVRIDTVEARRIRRAIDGAFVAAMTVHAPTTEEPTAIDDQRDAWMALIDGLIGLAAGVPDRLIRRVDAAFDDLLIGTDG